MIERKSFYIDGDWVAPHIEKDHPVIDPSIDEPCAIISLAGREDVDAAVSAARTAFPGWSLRPMAERIALLEQLARIYAERGDELAAVISMEMGAPIDMARSQQVGAGSNHLDSLIHAAKAFEPIQPLGDHAPATRIIHEAAGVCGLITPWNWPMNQITLKVVAALAAGCTVVLKPSEEAPLSALMFAEMIHEAGLPRGVFNLINGDGIGTGRALSGHPDIDVISFTGSTRAGIDISRNAAESLKRVYLELGGKGANLVFADADDKAVKRGVLHMMNNSGQSCNAPSRMLIERSRYDAAVQEAAVVAQGVQVNSAHESGRHIGPVVSERQFNRIQDLIQQGIDEGARLVAGGPGRPDGRNRGFFVRPTVFADVTPDMTLWREEIFGPVLCMTPFEDEEEALTLANDTVYGLTNYVQSSDDSRRVRLARALRSGMVEMNGEARGAGAPFGGVKRSGNGREGGRWGLEEFFEIKAVSGWGGQ